MAWGSCSWPRPPHSRPPHNPPMAISAPGTAHRDPWAGPGRGRAAPRTHYLCIRETMVLKAAWTSAAEQVHTTGSVCRCRTSDRNWGRGGGGSRAAPAHTPPGGRRPHLPLPVGGVDEDDVLRQLLVGDQDVVQLVVHGLPGDLRTQARPQQAGRPAPGPHQRPTRVALGLGQRPRGWAGTGGRRGPTCSWLRASGQRSLSRLLARSFCGRAGCRSFSDVLRPRRPACFPSDLGDQPRCPRPSSREPGRGRSPPTPPPGSRAGGTAAPPRPSAAGDRGSQPVCAPPTRPAQPTACHLVEGMTRDSVLVMRPLGGNFSVNTSRVEVSASGLSSGCAGGSAGAGVLCREGELSGHACNTGGPSGSWGVFRPPPGRRLPARGHGRRRPRATQTWAPAPRLLLREPGRPAPRPLTPAPWPRIPLESPRAAATKPHPWAGAQRQSRAHPPSAG